MAKHNNFGDWATGIADAIRDMRGTGEKINAQDYEDEIRAIEPLLDTLEITENGEADVKNYKKANVNVHDDSFELLKTILNYPNDNFDLTIPYGITHIGVSSLMRTNTNSGSAPYRTFLPKSIQEIGGYNFWIFSVYYDGTFDEWIKIKKGSYNRSDIFYNIASSDQYCALYCKNSNDEYFKVSDEIQNYTVPNDITELKQGAFSGIYLKPEAKLYINSNIKTIGDACFHYLIGVNEIIFEDGMTIDASQSNDMFFGSQVKKVNMFKTEALGNNMFKSCTSLKEVVFQDGLKAVGYINGTSYKGNTFHGCNKLEKVVLPQTLLEIGYRSFSGCTSLKNIIIPSSVTKIDNNAFESCIANIIIESSIPFTIGSSTFYSFRGKIFVPKGTKDAFISATNWSAQASKIYEKYVVVFNIPSALLNNENITYSIDDGKTYQQFTNGTLSLQEVASIKIKSTDSSQTILIGTTSGGNDVGTISNSELTFSFTTDTNVYLTIQ